MHSSTTSRTHVQARLAWAVATRKQRTSEEHRVLLASLLAEAEKANRERTN